MKSGLLFEQFYYKPILLQTSVLHEENSTMLYQKDLTNLLITKTE